MPKNRWNRWAENTSWKAISLALSPKVPPQRAWSTLDDSFSDLVVGSNWEADPYTARGTDLPVINCSLRGLGAWILATLAVVADELAIRSEPLEELPFSWSQLWPQRGQGTLGLYNMFQAFACRWGLTQR